MTAAIIAYTRVSTDNQSVEAQRHAIAQRYNVTKWFTDEATSGATKALKRSGFAALYGFAREGDTVVVAAIDRLGRDTIDVLETVEALKSNGVTVVSLREGFDLSTPIGEAMLTILAAIGKLERSNIKARQMAGIDKAKADGRKLGAPKQHDDAAIAAWRKETGSSIQATADHWKVSTATVKRACKAGGLTSA